MFVASINMRTSSPSCTTSKAHLCLSTTRSTYHPQWKHYTVQWTFHSFVTRYSFCPAKIVRLAFKFCPTKIIRLAFKFCPTKIVHLDCSKIHLIKVISNTKKKLHWKGYGANQMLKWMLLSWFQCFCIYWWPRKLNKQCGVQSQLL